METYHFIYNGREWTLIRQGSINVLAAYPGLDRQEAVRQAIWKILGQSCTLHLHHLDGTVEEVRTFPATS